MADYINNDAKELLLKPFKTLRNLKVIKTNTIELDPEIDYETINKNPNWTLEDGTIKTDVEKFRIPAGTGINALYLESYIGVNKMTTEQTTTNRIMRIEDLILGNYYIGKRGYKGLNKEYNFVIYEVSSDDELGPFNQTTLVPNTTADLSNEGALYEFIDNNFGQWINPSGSMEKPLTFGVKINDEFVGATRRYLIFTEEYSLLNEYKNVHIIDNTEKHKLIKEIDNDMSTVATSVIEISYEQKVVVQND